MSNKEQIQIQVQQPESPFNPFNSNSSSMEEEDMNDPNDSNLNDAFHDTFQEHTDSLHMHLVETDIAPMPNSPPPPPPETPPNYVSNDYKDGNEHYVYEDTVAATPTVAHIPPPMPNTLSSTPPVPAPEQAPVDMVTNGVTSRAMIMPEELPPALPGITSKKKNNKKSKKGEKKKKGTKKGTKTKKGKKVRDENGNGNKNGNGNGRVYQQQYNSMQSPPPSHPDPNIVHYAQENNRGVGGGGIFSSLFQPTPSHVTSLYPTNPKHNSNSNAREKTPSTNNTSTSRQRFYPRSMPTISSPRRLMRVNIGVVNSADGEGTTIPQILHRMRYMTLTLSALTIAFESWAMFFNAIFLKADKVILGCYLLFFVGLLLCFELVRGTPKAHKISMLGIVEEMTSVGNMADVVWRNALEDRWARRIRYFLQDNFGIFYSCVGRSFFFIVVGGLAFGQDFILIQIIGVGYILMGLWLITLRIRYPALEKALIMDLEEEFGHPREYVNQNDEESVISWSNVSTSMRSSANGSERQSLLTSQS